MGQRLALHNSLKAIAGVNEVYFQPPQNVSMVYPCIVYQRDSSWVSQADNIKYLLRKRYQVTVLDRNPDSGIPDLVENFPLTRFDRFYITAGINHFVFQMHF